METQKRYNPNVKPYADHDLAYLGVKFIGYQERFNNYALETFLDLKTGSSFVRLPTEGIEEARDRIRKGFNNK